MDEVDGSLERSATAAVAAPALRRLRTAQPEALDAVRTDPVAAARLVAVLGASEWLTGTLLADPSAVTRLGHPRPWDELDEIHRAAGPDELVAAQRRVLTAIAATDLVGELDVVAATAALSRLAGAVLARCVELTAVEAIAVVAMGKLGGEELNYASDVDVVLVADGDPVRATRAGRRIVEMASRCYRVDTALRPEGRAGPLVRSVDAYAAYWERWAEPWERQALLKATPMAGAAEVGARFAEAAGHALWDRPLSTDDLRALRALRARGEEAVRRAGRGHADVKLGPGGIRDIELPVQLLQLVHGRHDPALRVRSTLDALDELGAAGYVDPTDATALADAYRCWRRIEHGVQLWRGQQRHDIPSDPDAVEHLARVLGHRSSADASAADRLRVDRGRHRTAVRDAFERLWFRPLLEAFAGATGGLTPDAAADRLAAAGFTDAARTRDAVRELTTGLSRTSRLMGQLLPVLLDWLSQAPDPDQGLLGLRSLLADTSRAPRLTAAFRESPEVARRLCALVGTSTWLTEMAARHPDLLPRLPTLGSARPTDAAEAAVSAQRALEWRGSPDERQRALRRWSDRHLLAIAAADLFDDAPAADTGRALALLAEAAVHAAIDVVDPQVPFAVIAVGRLGERQLSYASDLDLLFVHDGVDATDGAEAERAAGAVVRFLGGGTPARRIWTVDAGLRPEGRQGPLSRTLAGYQVYWDRWAEPWERLAMLHARPVAGDAGLGRAWIDRCLAHVWCGPPTPDDLRSIRLVKARGERERVPAGDDPRFHLKLGRGALADVELTAALLQVVHGVRAPHTTAAIEALRVADVLTLDEATALVDAHDLCERIRARWQLVRGGPGDSLPSDPRWATPLARSLATTPVELRDAYLRATRRARAVVEHRFYTDT
ncbi:MAG TPA: bifunctional [glutamine synthetase] adenylyltransferase/[glutamine synthetase]-adenylyl-L-tyrosine phosphorylase [Acidimicrobiales bacterium]|nr:bifunctional [glutamine synthetase] adenylyltransferase/[glutamine synthetase]-adenylyl-L-tyrosine phosphorylase [Acidimicrobiales bacterium]